MTKSVVLIFHENERRSALPRFAIWHLANAWQRENIRVVSLFGTGTFIPADLAILHVDLTVVPEAYIDFAHRYPLILNDRIRDIRKSSFSRNKVNRDDGYEGPVIVKSELNYAGQPEQKLLGSAWSRLALRIACRLPSRWHGKSNSAPHFRSPADYLIRNSPRCVPPDWFDRDDILVEHFMPEIQEDLYCLRNYHFLGDRGICVLRKGVHPIVNNSTVTSREVVEVHPEIAALAKRMHFDYGKFDYVVHEGRPVLFDVNKTPGGSNRPTFLAMSSEWAKGIRSYL